MQTTEHVGFQVKTLLELDFLIQSLMKVLKLAVTGK